MSRLSVLLFALAVAVGISALLSIPVFLLWNGCLVGAVAGVNEITWLQGWGLTLLCSLLFKPSGVELSK